MAEPGPREGQAPTKTILAGDDEAEAEYQERRVLFRCGNWCYTGHVTLETAKITLRELPLVIPALQRQQNRLHFYCNASSIPRESSFREPVAYVAAASEFAAAELASDHVHRELSKWSDVYTWMDSDGPNTYFELVATPPPCMEGISLAASKTYARGIIFITVYFEGTFYVVIQSGEGDQPLLDVKFPDVSQPGQGVHLVSYPQDDDGKRRPFEAIKLTLWRSMAAADREASASGYAAADGEGGGSSSWGGSGPASAAPAMRTTDLSTDGYIQMYTILKADDERGVVGVDNSHHDVLFRFGSWCYSGSVQLTPIIDLADLPHLIPALRVQQSRLDFLCDASAMPNHSPFSKPMKYMAEVTPHMERELCAAEGVLHNLLEQFSTAAVDMSAATSSSLSSTRGGSSSLHDWLEGGETTGSFFEFQLALDRDMERAFKNVELVASKTYTPTGVVIVAIYYSSTIYVVLSETAGELPLLDSRFPDVSSKGRGYLVASHANGLDKWPQLRKVSIWQTAAAMKADVDRSTVAMANLSAKEEAAEATPEERRRAYADPSAGPAGKTVAAATKTAPKVASAAAASKDEPATTPVTRPAETKRSLRSGGGGSGGSAVGGGGGPAAAADGASSSSPFSLTAQAAHDPQFQAKRETDRKVAEEAKRTNNVASDTTAGGDSTSDLLKAQPKNPLLAQLNPLDRVKVNAPHRVPSLSGSGLTKLEKVRASLGQSGEAPWDEFGRPKAMGFKK